MLQDRVSQLEREMESLRKGTVRSLPSIIDLGLYVFRNRKWLAKGSGDQWRTATTFVTGTKTRLLVIGIGVHLQDVVLNITINPFRYQALDRIASSTVLHR